MTGLPRLPEPPFRRAVPTTPADRAGAPVDCFPAHAAFPKWQEGRHPHCHFRGLHRLHSVTARRIAQPPKVTFVTRLRPSLLPDRAARQLPDLSTIFRVEILLHRCFAPSGRTANGQGVEAVSSVGASPLRIGPHILCRHQPRVVSEPGELAREMMRPHAGLHSAVATSSTSAEVVLGAVALLHDQDPKEASLKTGEPRSYRASFSSISLFS